MESVATGVFKRFSSMHANSAPSLTGPIKISEKEINKIADTYHAWRGEKDAGEYKDVPGFCKSATTDEIKEHDYVLTPGRYVGAAEIKDDGIPFEEKMAQLTARLNEQFSEANKLVDQIRKNLTGLGFEVK